MDIETHDYKNRWLALVLRHQRVTYTSHEKLLFGETYSAFVQNRKFLFCINRSHSARILGFFILVL